MTKLYHHVSRFLVRRRISRAREAVLKWALTLKPGDIINDCTSFNAKIIEIQPQIWQTGRGWYYYNFDFKVSPFGGYCSLFDCGVIPALSRDKIESNYVNWAEFQINNGVLKSWYGNDIASFEKELDILQKRIEIIKSGGHITNEHGMILKEFSRHPDSFKDY